jgi:hypothetical protein
MIRAFRARPDLSSASTTVPKRPGGIARYRRVRLSHDRYAGVRMICLTSERNLGRVLRGSPFLRPVRLMAYK